MKEHEFEIIGFWAYKDKSKSKLFTEGHQKVLYDHGLGFFTSNETYWHESKTTYVLMAVKNGEAMAGIRMETKIKDRLLPLEKALRSKSNDVESFIKSLESHKIYEACGLWNSKLYAGFGFPTLLCRTSVAIAPKMGYFAALSLNGFYTYRIPRDMGSKMVKSLGDNGLFAYPIKRYHSSIWLQDDLVNMKHASLECREIVKDIRNNAGKFTLETTINSKESLIKFNLNF